MASNLAQAENSEIDMSVKSTINPEGNPEKVMSGDITERQSQHYDNTDQTKDASKVENESQNYKHIANITENKEEMINIAENKKETINITENNLFGEEEILKEGLLDNVMGTEEGGYVKEGVHKNLHQVLQQEHAAASGRASRLQEL